MKNFVDLEQKLKNVKSTAYVFTVIAVLGLILVILFDFDVIRPDMAVSSKIIISVVMGILFLIFLTIGIQSFCSLKTLKEMAQNQKTEEKGILETFLEKHSHTLLAFQPLSVEPEEIFFEREAKIASILQVEHAELSPSEFDHMVELIYENIFGTQ